MSETLREASARIMTEMLDEAERCYKSEFTEAERREVFKRGNRKINIESIAVGIAYERRRAEGLE